MTWPSGAVQRFTDVAIPGRARLVEGGRLEPEPAGTPVVAPASTAAVPPPAAAPPDTWLYEPFPAPTFTATDLAGQPRSLAALAGKPALLLFLTTAEPAARDALGALGRGGAALTRAGVTALAIALDPPAQLDRVRSLAPAGVPVIATTPELAMGYALLNRHVFMNRQDLRLPTAFLIDAAGRVVRLYRGPIDAARIAADAGAIEVATPEAGLSRAVPFAGTFYTPIPSRNFLPYGRELMDQGLEAAAVVAFERASQANPSASTLYRLGTLLAKCGEAGRARAAYERALTPAAPISPRRTTTSGRSWRKAAISRARSRASGVRSRRPPTIRTRSTTWATRCSSAAASPRPAASTSARIALQPDFPEALNNLGLLFGRAGDLAAAERYFRDALARRDTYGEAANNLALVLVSRGQTNEAIALLDAFLSKTTSYENAYLTLAKIHLAAGQYD